MGWIHVADASVAQVVSDTEIAINRGLQAGIRKGDVLIAYRDISVEDPESLETLGTVRRPEIRFEVTEIQDKLAVGRSATFVGEDEGPNYRFSLVFPVGSRKRMKVTDSDIDEDSETVYMPSGRGITVVREEQEPEEE